MSPLTAVQPPRSSCARSDQATAHERGVITPPANLVGRSLCVLRTRVRLRRPATGELFECDAVVARELTGN